MAAISKLVASVKEGMKGLASAGLFSLWIGGKPITASRPRVTKQGWAYYAPAYKKWMAETTPVVEALRPAQLTGPVALLVEVFVPRPKKTEHVAPMGDLDNYAKGPMDLLTKLQRAWVDDRQIVFLTVVKSWVDEEAETGFLLNWCEVNDD
jgi:Holliday junction resolvase RusA-like endonuclease